MTTRRTCVVLLLVGLLAGCRTQASTFVLSGATIIDGTGAPPLVDGALVIAEGRISCLGPARSCQSPAVADTVDGSGFWVIPGLIDTHIHPIYENQPVQTERRERLRFLLGVTSTRDASTAKNFDGNVRAAARASNPKWPVPRLIVAGRVEPAGAIDPDAAAATVARLHRDGATSIKVKAPFDEEILGAIVGAAREANLDVWGHAWGEGPTRSLVRQSVAAGMKGLAHLTGIAPLAVPSEVLASPPAPVGEAKWWIWRRTLWLEADPDSLASVARNLAASGVWLEPMLVSEELWAAPYTLPVGLHQLLELPLVVHRIVENPDLPDRSAADLERLAESVKIMREFVREFHDAGGVVVTGTDEALAPGLSLQEEIGALVRAGLTPGDALAASTRDAAQVIGVQDSLGTLEPGKIADFVVLEGDPLSDIANTQLVARVAKGGVLYDPATLFDNLAADMRSRSSAPWIRLVAGFGAIVIVVILTLWAIVRQRVATRP